MNAPEITAAKMICKSIDALVKEVRWFRLLVEEAMKEEAGRQELEELEDGDE